MHLKQRIIVFSIFLLCVCLYACEKNSDSTSASNGTWQTSSGTVSKVDSYPLYSLTYTADYKFDEFLQTGNIPLYSAAASDYQNFSCTCLSAFGGDTRLFGRNYDWPEKTAYYIVFTNPDDAYASVSTVDLGFFQYDKSEAPDHPGNQSTLRVLPYHPFDGINEKGVAVGMNALASAVSPYDASKVTIGELQLIRLILDYAASTQEALELIPQYNIRMEDPPIHYLIADSSGHSAIVEFVSGQMKVMENTQPWQVTTNFVIDGLSSYQQASCWRYRTAHSTLEQCGGTLAESNAFGILESVSVSGTRWSSVFNLTSGSIQISMGRNFDDVYSFSVP